MNLKVLQYFDVFALAEIITVLEMGMNIIGVILYVTRIGIPNFGLCQVIFTAGIILYILYLGLEHYGISCKKMKILYVSYIARIFQIVSAITMGAVMITKMPIPLVDCDYGAYKE